MRRLDKSKPVNSEYQSWSAGKSVQETGEWNSNGKYYPDVFWGLLICQDGLCAYSEKRLVEKEVLNQVKAEFVNPQIARDLLSGLRSKYRHIEVDHYLPKSRSGLHWNWENVFAVFQPINSMKLAKEPDLSMKPDISGYEAKNYLQYDSETHRFVPRGDLSEELRVSVWNTIEILGLNQVQICDERRRFIQEQRKKIEDFGYDPDIHQYITAFQMALQSG